MSKQYPYFKVYSVKAGGLQKIQWLPDEFVDLESCAKTLSDYVLNKKGLFKNPERWGLKLDSLLDGQYCIQEYSGYCTAMIVKLFTFREFIQPTTSNPTQKIKLKQYGKYGSNAYFNIDDYTDNYWPEMAIGTFELPDGEIIIQ